MTIAVWKVKDLLNAGKINKGFIKGMTPICEAAIGKSTIVNTLYFDHGHSDNHNINIVIGTDKGAKFYTLKL